MSRLLTLAVVASHQASREELLALVDRLEEERHVAADEAGALSLQVDQLEGKLANAAEERAELIDQLCDAKTDAQRDAGRATAAEQDLRAARRTIAEQAARLAAVEALLAGRRT